MLEKINITDIDKLHITRVKFLKIHFTYDGIKYMLIEDGEEDAHISLYKRVYTDDNRLKNVHINGKITLMHTYSFIKDVSKSKPRNTTYACIDKQYFVKKLVELGFAYGIYEESYNEYKQKVDEINELIQKLQDEKNQLKDKWEKTSGHGSKTDSIAHKFKIRACERVKGAKDGDWCKRFKTPYGSTSKEYGGTLTDLFNLPYGTYFHVENGGYDACISYDGCGNKTIITPESEVKLTKENCSAYITLYQ